MNTYRILVHIMLLGLSIFSLYMYYVNKQNFATYNLDFTKRVSGQFLSFHKEETRKKIYFNFQLRGISTVFTVPSPEWKSFDFGSFKSNISIGDNLILTIPADIDTNEKTINVFQIQHGGKNFIDWKKMKQLRMTEMYLALAMGFLGIIGLIHHYYRPWL